MTPEQFRTFAKGEVLIKYPTLIDLTMDQVDGIIMMIQPLLDQVEQSQSALGEKDFIIKKKDEIIESQKQTFDSLLKKYEAIDKEYGETIEKLSEKFESSLTTKDKEIEELKDEIENDRLSAVVDAKTIVRLEERIKELEEGIIDLQDQAWRNGVTSEYVNETCKSLLSQSKEQKEGGGE